MRGYEDDEYEDYDDYEEERYDQKEGVDEDDEYEEEEEEPKPTKEELEYLELRQKLKESIRKRMKKEASGSHETKKDNFGSFFGPSKPVIAQRVIQESKSLLENQHLAARILKARQKGNKTSSSSPGGSKPGVRPQAPRVSELKKKAQKIKDTRDYSFLLSEDAGLPDSPKRPPARTVPAPSSEARAVKLSSQCSRQTPLGNVKHANGGHEERRPSSANGHSNPRPGSSNGHSNPRAVSANGHSNPRAVSANGRSNPRPTSANGHSNPRPGSANGHSNPRSGSANGNTNPRVGPANAYRNPGPGSSKLSSASKPQVENNRKQLCSHSGSGPGRPAVSNGLLPKKHIPPPQKFAPQGLKNSTPAGAKPSAAKMQSTSKYQVEPRRDVREPDRGKVPSKHAVASTRPQAQAQMDKPQKQIAMHNKQHDQRPKKRPGRPFPDDDDDDDGAVAISMIRKMFGYNPQKFAGHDEDDSDMEANFDDIMREEKRSARIAREEDEEQLRLIEEEERRERMRKMGKRRKMG